MWIVVVPLVSSADGRNYRIQPEVVGPFQSGVAALAWQDRYLKLHHERFGKDPKGVYYCEFRGGPDSPERFFERFDREIEIATYAEVMAVRGSLPEIIRNDKGST